MGYAELHCLSNFSFLRGASHPEELVARAAELGYAALADHRRMLGRGRGARARRGPRARPEAHRRQRVPPRRRPALRAARDRSPRLRPALPADHACAARRAEGQLPAGARATSHRQRRFARKRRGSLDAAAATCRPASPCGCPPRARRGRGRWLAASSPAGSGSRSSCSPPAGSRRLAALQQLGRELGLPLVAAGDVHMHVRGRRALQDVLTATRLGVPVEQAGYALFPNGERHLRPLHAARGAVSARAARPRRSRSPRAARSRSTSCATNTRARSCPRARRRRAGCGG